MSERRTCSVCGTEGLEGECPVCAAAWEKRRPADEMSPEERVAALDALPEKLEIEFSKIHRRVEELVGRPVFTHEMGTQGMAYLRHEILTGHKPDLDGILAKLPHDKPVIPVELPPEEPANA